MGNERSGRGGIPSEVFDRAERLIDSGYAPHQVARQLNIDRKTAHKIAEGRHVYQREERFHECPICHRRVDELPCKICLATPLDLEPVRIDPAELVERLFDRDETAAELMPQLVLSIGQLGVIQPPVVVKTCGGRDGRTGQDGRDGQDGWLVVLGGKRIEAALEAGLPKILCLEARANRHRQWDALLTDEFLRVERNPIERAKMFQTCLEDPEVSHTQKTLGERIGRSQSYVAQHVNLLKLPEYWRDLIITRVITLAHVRLLLPFFDDARLLAGVWREIDAANPPTVREFRDMLERVIEELNTQAAQGAEDGNAEEGPLDALLAQANKRSARRGPPTKDLKFRFAAEAAETIELKLSAIAEAERCESLEETLELLINFYWDHPPTGAAAAQAAAANGLRLVA
jgi:ParB/RepB/Spo0J family partition protein